MLGKKILGAVTSVGVMASLMTVGAANGVGNCHPTTTRHKPQN